MERSDEELGFIKRVYIHSTVKLAVILRSITMSHLQRTQCFIAVASTNMKKCDLAASIFRVKMEAANFPETSASYTITTRRHNPKPRLEFSSPYKPRIWDIYIYIYKSQRFNTFKLVSKAEKIFCPNLGK
jgi:hypothetical protein